MNVQDETKARVGEPQGLVNTACCGRVSGKLFLTDRIAQLRNRANELETIYGMLPTVLTPEQDQAVWNLVAGINVSH